MSKERICDICDDPIRYEKSLTGAGLTQYKVSIKRIDEGCTMEGYFKRKEKFDICPYCMKRFTAWLKKGA